MNVSPLTLISGVAASMLTGWLRKSPWFGFFDEKDTKKVHAVAAVLSSVLMLAVLFLTGELQVTNMKEAMDLVFNAVMSYSSAVGYHELNGAFNGKPAAASVTE